MLLGGYGRHGKSLLSTLASEGPTLSVVESIDDNMAPAMALHDSSGGSTIEANLNISKTLKTEGQSQSHDYMSLSIETPCAEVNQKKKSAKSTSTQRKPKKAKTQDLTGSFSNNTNATLIAII